MEKSLKELITYGIKCIIFIFKKAFNKKLEKKGSLIIIGNGPSFLETIKNHSDFLKKNELLCVNRFVDTEYYTILKPKYYVIADSAFFDDINKIDTENRERIKSIQDSFKKNLLKKTTRKITLFIPLHINISNFKLEIESNPNIKIERYIMNPINVSNRTLRNILYKYEFGMPKAQNVLIAAVYLALNLGYSIIYLTGCDYSRLEGICLDKNNNICSIDQHFYGKERIKGEFKFHKVLQSLSLAFKGHILLSDYAKYLGREIYNASEKSYIDAYKKYHI